MMSEHTASQLHQRGHQPRHPSGSRKVNAGHLVSRDPVRTVPLDVIDAGHNLPSIDECGPVRVHLDGVDGLDNSRRFARRQRGYSHVSPHASTAIAEGTLYSLARRRLKTVSSEILRRLGNGLAAELRAELGRIEHDLHIHTQIGTHIDSGEVLSLLANRQKIRKALSLDASDQGAG